MKTLIPSRDNMETVLGLVQAEYGIEPGAAYGPTIVMDFDWFGHGEWPAIIWEEGPYEWAVESSFKLLEELAPAGLPRGMWFEAETNWAMGVYVAA